MLGAALLLFAGSAGRGATEPAGDCVGKDLWAAADRVEAWAEKEQLAWPARAAARCGGLSRDTLWARMDARWSQAGPALRGAYAELGYVRALKADQWRLLAGQAGTPTVDAYLAATAGPLSRVLLMLDDLQRVVGCAVARRESPGELPGAPAEATEAGRAVLTGAEKPPSLDRLLDLLPLPLRFSPHVPVSRGNEVALAVGFPLGRHGADLALLLPLVASAVASTTETPSRVALVLHQRGLPLLEIAFPGADLASFRSGDLDLWSLWRPAQQVDYASTAPLAAADFVLNPWEMPPGVAYAPPTEMTPAQVAAVAGIRDASGPEDIQVAARQQLKVKEGTLLLAAVVAASPAAARQLQQATAAGPLRGGETMRVWTRGAVVVWARGPAAAVETALQAVGRPLRLTEQPPVEVPAPVRAVLEPGTWPPAPAQPSFVKRLTICRETEKPGPRSNPQPVFPAGTKAVSAWLEIERAPYQTIYLVEWHRDGRLAHRSEVFQLEGSQTKCVGLRDARNEPLQSGRWRVEVYQNGVKVAEREFEIVASPPK